MTKKEMKKINAIKKHYKEVLKFLDTVPDLEVLGYNNLYEDTFNTHTYIQRLLEGIVEDIERYGF